MRCLVDTNILVYTCSSVSPFHKIARERLESLEDAGLDLVVTNQVLREYVSVVTRKSVLSEPRTPREAVEDVRRFTQVFGVIPEPQDAERRWLDLVERYGLHGPTVHDAFLVATA